MPQYLDIRLAILSAWGFQERFSLMVSPKKSKLITLSNSIPLIDNLGKKLILVPGVWKSMNLVLRAFKDSLLTASQL